MSIIFEIFQQFEYFLVAFPARFIISASIQLPSLIGLYLMVGWGFNFFINCECCDDLFGFRVVSCDDCDECGCCVVVSNGWDDCVMNILVDMVAEFNFQMDMMVGQNFQMSVMNMMALVLWYGCFLDHQTIMIAVSFR